MIPILEKPTPGGYEFKSQCNILGWIPLVNNFNKTTLDPNFTNGGFMILQIFQYDHSIKPVEINSIIPLDSNGGNQPPYF